MILPSILHLSFAALWANKLRSGLTLLGIIIGVTSVITIISALEGMQGSIEAEFDKMGPATFFVQRIGMAMSEKEWLEKIKRKPLKEEYVDLIVNGCDLCEKVSPGTWGQSDLKYGDRSLRDVAVVGVSSNRIDIVDLEVAEGRFHSSEDDAHNRRVAFIGHKIYEELFHGLDPIGKDIRIAGRKYTVIGLGKEVGGLFGAEQDERVYIPFSTHRRDFGSFDRGIHMVIKAQSVPQLNEAMDQVRSVLRSARHVPFDKPDDFDVLTADTILEVLNNATRLFRFGLFGISMISIVVGGIVVMNIMMVAVTERTREIGIRKAVGAKQNHILMQFLFEALITTLLGGMIGIVLGFFIAKAVIAMININIAPSGLAIAMGLTISTSVGLIFGIFPAMKAARMDPIKALSYE